MDIRSRTHIEKLYFLSFTAVLIFLPWSVTLCGYSLIAMSVFGLLTTDIFKKIRQLRQHPQVLAFVVFYCLYLLGLLYTPNITEGFRGVEQKLALFVVPLIAASSVSFTDNQRKQAVISFVFSNALLTITCVGLNILLINGGDYQQMNFDHHTLGRFQELHSSASPLWMRFSYVSFGNPFIAPTYFSIYLTLCIIALFYYNTTSAKLTFLKYIVIGWFSVVIILLASRMGIILLIGIGTMNLLYHLSKRKFSRQESLLSAGFIAAVCLLVYISPITRFRVLEEPLATPLHIPSNYKNWNSVNLRLLEWGASLKGIKEYGIKGTGTGGTLDVLHSYYEQADLGALDKKYNSHNQYLETYLEIGLAGFIALLVCLFIPMIHAVKTGNKLLLSLIIMVAIGCLTTSMFEKTKGLLFYVAFVSLFMFTENKYDNEVEG